MATVSIQLIKDLRESTGAGMSDCKAALVECDSDMDKAVEYLRKKGMASAAKKSGRIAAEGACFTYLHGARIGVLLEINCETDFVARNEDFQALGNDLCLQIAAMSPRYVSPEEVPAEEIEKEKEIRKEAAKQSGKPEAMLDKIVEGQISKWFKDVCLLDQVSVKDPEGKKDIRTLLTELTAKTGENIRVRRFNRFEVGEGLEKRADDFVEEVRRQAGQA